MPDAAMDSPTAAYLIFVVIIGGLRGYYQRRVGRRVAVTEDRSWLDRAVLTFGVLAMAPIPVSHLVTDWYRFADAQHPEWLRWIGVAFLAGGAWLFWRSHADLGRNWSAQIAIQHDHALVEHGVYRRIRHPMYSAMLLSGIGQFFVLQNWIAGPSLVLAAMLFCVVRVPREERLLTATFGPAYAAYRARTGAVIPRL